MDAVSRRSLGGLMAVMVVMTVGAAGLFGAEPPAERSESSRSNAPKRPHLGDPKSTFRSYIEAVRRNDLQAAMECWVIDDSNKSGALDVIVGLFVSPRRLAQVAEKKFGKEGTAAIPKDCLRKDLSDQALGLTARRLEDADVKVQGDTAELTIRWKEDDGVPNPAFWFTDRPFSFRKVKGNWKIDANKMADLKRGADFFQPGTWGPLFQDEVRIMNDAVDGMEKGKLRTAEELSRFIEARAAEMVKRYEEEMK